MFGVKPIKLCSFQQCFNGNGGLKPPKTSEKYENYDLNIQKHIEKTGPTRHNEKTSW